MKIKKGSIGDIKVLRPTLMATVPVSHEALYDFCIYQTAGKSANTHFQDKTIYVELLFLFPPAGVPGSSFQECGDQTCRHEQSPKDNFSNDL